MLVGYCRTSTIEQLAGFEAQIEELKNIGCEKIFSEQISSVAHRNELDAALDWLRDGDTLVVTKLSRLARSTKHLLQIVDRIEAKSASLKILNMGMDISTPTGKMFLTMIGAIDTWEREEMLERQLIGIAKAKAENKYKGRKPTARAKSDDVIRLKAEGESALKIAAQLEIGVASVYRILNAHTVS